MLSELQKANLLSLAVVMAVVVMAAASSRGGGRGGGVRAQRRRAVPLGAARGAAGSRRPTVI